MMAESTTVLRVLESPKHGEMISTNVIQLSPPGQLYYTVVLKIKTIIKINCRWVRIIFFASLECFYK